ncbi:MAG: PEGA domain-containing protein [Rikenellaceae bacterium]|nr:PEGA domain-containing protein [Rikenellaceae bacterium]
MKKLLVVMLFLLSISAVGSAQELEFKSFEFNVHDAAARAKAVVDLSENPCALLRVYVAVESADFKGNLGILEDSGKPAPRGNDGYPKGNLGVKGKAQKIRNSEYVMYIPAGSKSITVQGEGFLPFTYHFNQEIKGLCTYELYLKVPESGPTKQALESQFLAMTVTPATATVVVDEMMRTLEGGQLFLELPFGRHTYQVMAPMHHMQQGEFEISGKGRTDLSIALKPAYGTLKVSSTPSGATVMVDGVVKGTTPCTLQVESGNHFVQVMHEGYISYAQNLALTDGATLPVVAGLKANFAQVTLRAPHAESEIWLGGEKIGTGQWSGRLNAGTYSVEVRTEGYKTATQNIEVVADSPKSYTLTGGHAVYGVLKVTSQPMGATVKLDGTVLGTTPFMSNEVLIGNRTLEVELKGYDTHREVISLVRDAVKSVELTLKKEELVTATPSTSPNSQKSYKVGDYYNENGRVGVVFWVDASGQCGKIISMKATGGTQWSSAVQWCRSQGAGWRMPTKQELVALSKVSRLINSTLTSKGGSALSGWYWVSDNYNTERGWRVNPLTGWTETGKKICYDYQARAVAEVAFVSSSDATQKMVEASSSAKTTTPGQYPQATDRLLTHSDVASRSKKELRVMRNEIFARHGYIFKSADLRNHFSKQSWYRARYSNVDAKLTPIEQKNVAFIRKYEQQ